MKIRLWPKRLRKSKKTQRFQAKLGNVRVRVRVYYLKLRKVKLKLRKVKLKFELPLVSDMWSLVHMQNDKPVETVPWVTVPAHEPKRKKKKRA